ncbi:MAG: type II toxin-antitoxin system VapC family toxin [Patulibacter sp.]|nr:type II toxin-antitoxin system VapC family toxin [Patulibacter sp.]
MLIVDASVLIEFAVGGPMRAAAVRELQGRPLLAPELIDAEILHAVKGLERGGDVEADKATRFVQSLVHAPFLRVSHRPLLLDAWKLRHRLSAYDALYVALARRTGFPVVTCDRRWAAAGDLGVTVITVG